MKARDHYGNAARTQLFFSKQCKISVNWFCNHEWTEFFCPTKHANVFSMNVWSEPSFSWLSSVKVFPEWIHRRQRRKRRFFPWMFDLKPSFSWLSSVKVFLDWISQKATKETKVFCTALCSGIGNSQKATKGTKIFCTGPFLWVVVILVIFC